MFLESVPVLAIHPEPGAGEGSGEGFIGTGMKTKDKASLTLIPGPAGARTTLDTISPVEPTVSTAAVVDALGTARRCHGTFAQTADPGLWISGILIIARCWPSPSGQEKLEAFTTAPQSMMAQAAAACRTIGKTVGQG